MSDDRTWGVLASQSDEDALRSRINHDADSFHADVAAREIHWQNPSSGAWLARADGGPWRGWTVQGQDTHLEADAWTPWSDVLDQTAAPYYRWFVGGQTNACFNLVDRHLLHGRADKTAIIFEGDRWDPSKNEGRGGPVTEQHFSYRVLFEEIIARMRVLQDLGLQTGDRIAFNLPNVPEQVFYMLAAQRLGIVYTPVFGGFSAKTLSDRIHDAGAKLVITADGGYRNAEGVAYKGTYTDPALDNYIPRETALTTLKTVLDDYNLGSLADVLYDDVYASLEGEITLERSDVMRELGASLAQQNTVAAELAAELRTAVARQLADAKHDVEHVIVVQYTGQEIVEHARDKLSDDLVTKAKDQIAKDLGLDTFEQLADDAPSALWSKLNGVLPAVSVDANFPLFIIYTSGSTGKPKGVVHTHGSWLSGVSHTMRTVFNATHDDTLYVIGDPGWITGQSYLIAAPLVQGMTTVIAEGSPLFPHAGRFSSIIERYKVTLFKAGSTFLKAVMTDPASAREMADFDMSSLRAGTFCAEPVSPAVQQFAMDNICKHYINSYWATEHGGIVFSCPWGGYKPLASDAKTWSLPWIQAEVRIAETTATDGTVTAWRTAESGEKGELVITQPYPYLARTLWGDADNLFERDWCGDIARFNAVYFSRWDGELAYTQGDYARQHEDGAYTLHGRSDDVINVSGHRIGTEEIEGAILRDKTLREDSPVGNVVVVGAPHDEKGETPVAFLVAAAGRKLSDDDLARLQSLVRSEKGATAVPSDFLVVSAFPETRSGKYMRRTLRSILLDQPLGDISTLKNPESVEEIRTAVAQWKDFGSLTQARRVVQTWRYLRVETHEVAPGHLVALVVINSPPVNALSERTLDELHTALSQLAHQEDLSAMVVTGARNTFVAGADVKELLKIGEKGDLESAQTLPNAAQTAFATLENLDIPIIAAVNGPALGGGNELVLACSHVIAAKHAEFGQPEINLNLLPGYGGTQRLTRKLFEAHGADGAAEALRMMLDGRTIDAESALQIGLVDDIVTTEGLSTVEAAMAALRDHFAGGDALKSSTARRRKLKAQREQPLDIDASIVTHEGVARALNQIRNSGREKPADFIITAMLTGAQQGQSAGLTLEAELFAQGVCDPECGPTGISAFLEKRSAPLPPKPKEVQPDASADERATLIEAGRLLPMGASFFPGITPIPEYQLGYGVMRSHHDGRPLHGDPEVAEKELVFPTPQPRPNEALIYILASEMNFNDIWAITGIPVSPFDARDADVQVTGSGGVGLVAQLGQDLVREGRLSVGDIVSVYSGQSELMSPDQGLDPMAADFRIQGYEQNDGTHAQFLTVQGPQLHAKLPGLSIEEAGSYGLTMGTIHRALYNTLAIEPGKRLFVEGASTGTGYDCLRSALSSSCRALGMVSSDSRGERVEAVGGHAINRKDDRWSDIFTSVPDDPSQWEAWEAAGEAFVVEAEALAGGQIDYSVSHAGETAFPRSFQLLGENGVLTFYGASSGYRFTFMGKSGATTPAVQFSKAGLRAGQSLLVVYGPGAEDGIVDPVAIEAIEVGCQRGAQVAVLVDTVSQREFVSSLGFGTQMKGAVSIEEIERRLGDDFDPPGPFQKMPNPFTESAAFKDSVRAFSDRTLKPIGSAIAPLLRNTLDKRGLPDVVFERAGRDGLALATSLVKPNVGKVVYSEDLKGARFSFYAPQVWMRQRRILMPTAEIRGTHLNTSREFAEMQERIAAGHINILPPTIIPMEDVPQAHQAMWENRHAGANYVALHALPRTNLKSRDELYRAWAIRDALDRGETLTKVETGSAGALR
ncbi:AMP-binding protein [Luminiphilus sp.]|nr:AMP-binding protein [Luminiphilus sp.]